MGPRKIKMEEPHVHKYLRVKLGTKGYTVYKCMKPGCTRYIRRELVVGEMAECWRCGNEMQMNLRTAKQKKPHCLKCTRPHKTQGAA